jgi:RNA polymerase sigma factor (sigma-70 family)
MSADTANANLANVVHYLRNALDGPSEPDRDLLSRFTSEGDAAAFAELVARHGSLVLGVCRRLLRHEQDAEDAFQAVFLVLARKAGSLRWGGSAAPWLHEVATRTALRARSTIARRRTREKQVEQMPQPAIAAAEPNDWAPLLDEELNRLSPRYRDAVVLCELEGRPRKEAARLLGIPEGTLSSRLAAARKLLAERLSRRGVVLSGALLAGGVAVVPPALAEATVRAALLVAAGVEVTATAGVVALMRGVQMSMFLAKLKLVVAVVVVLGGLGLAGVAFQPGSPPQARADAPAAKPQNELERLRRENELLKLNLEVVLEKVRAQEAEIRTLKGQQATRTSSGVIDRGVSEVPIKRYIVDREEMVPMLEEVPPKPKDPLEQLDDALKALRAAPDKKSMGKAAEDLDRALKQLREQMKQGKLRIPPGK